MKMVGNLLKFEKRGDSYLCLNKGAGYEVGAIVYMPLWKSWAFMPGATHSFTSGMLDDIRKFMGQLKQ